MALPSAVSAQPPPVVPIPTFVRAILEYPGTFHARQVVLYGTLRTASDEWWLETDDGDRVRVVPGQSPVLSGRVELQADVFDIGRISQTDPRVTASAIPALLLRVGLDRWPRPGELVILRALRTTALRPAIKPNLKAVVLENDRFTGQVVSIVGQFRARNLYNDSPAEPGRHKYAFVLRMGAAALWVVGLRPRMNGVELDLRSRVDTDRWVEVAGIVRREKGLVWIEGQRMTAAPVPQELLPTPLPRAEALAQAEVMFSLPTEGEADVPTSTTVRIQFTRPIDPATIGDRIRATYAAEPGGDQQPPPFVASYATSDRVVTLRFRSSLGRFKRVVVELVEGFTALDGSLVKPWRLTFTTGGQS